MTIPNEAAPLQSRAPRVWQNVASYCQVGDRELPSTIRNLSISGVQLEMGGAVDQGTPVTLRLSTDASAKEHRALGISVLVAGEAVWCRPLESGGSSVGVRFLPMEKHELEFIIRFFFEEFGLRLWQWPDHDTRSFFSDLTCHYQDEKGYLKQGTIRDIRADGVSILTPTELPREMETQLRFSLGDNATYYCFGTVASSQPTETGYEVTVAVDSLDDALRDGLIRAVIKIFRQNT